MKTRIGFALLSMFASNAAFAADEPSLVGSIVQMLIMLVAVVALFFVVVKLIRRVDSVRGTDAKHIKWIESVAVGQRERVVMLQVADRVLLVGVTPSNVSLVTELALEKLYPANAADVSTSGNYTVGREANF